VYRLVSHNLVLKVLQLTLRKVGIESFSIVKHPDYHIVPQYYGKHWHKQFDIREIPLFGELAGDVINQKKSSHYYDKLYYLHQALVNLSRVHSPSEPINIVEVGVYKGGTSYFMCRVLKSLGINAKLHIFDTFEGHQPEDLTKEFDGDHTIGTFTKTSYEMVEEYLNEFDNVEIFKGRIQDMWHKIEEKNISFFHLDVDIYEPTKFCLNNFDELLAVGGSFIIDDYGFRTCPGIKRAVDEFVDGKSNYFSVHHLSGQCTLVKCYQ